MDRNTETSGQQYGLRQPAPPRGLSAFDGILPVDKPCGPTSHDVVDAVRRRFNIRKVGHGGTLDPNATGLLVLLAGSATKLSDRFMGSDKTYEGTMKLGISTDSHDAQGRIIAEADFSAVSREKLEETICRFRGDLLQTPPMVSAVKVNGVPLYKSARKGKTVERKPRLIHIYEFKLTGFEPPEASFFMTCTKGTYVRTICADIGDQLGCGAHLAALRRTRSGSIDIKLATPFEEIMKMDSAQLRDIILPLNRVAEYL